MTIRFFAISILGLAVLDLPAHAAVSFSNGSMPAVAAMSGFTTAANLEDLLVSAPATFVNTDLSETPQIYIDSFSGVEFFGYALTGGGLNGAQDRLSTSGSALLQGNPGGIIEVTDFSAVTFAFAGEFKVTNVAAGYCVEVNVTSFNQGGNCNNIFSVSSTGDVEFVGVVDTVPITSVWIGPSSSAYGSVDTEMTNFEIGQTPEVSTFAMFAAGLTLLGAARRRRKLAAAPSR